MAPVFSLVLDRDINEDLALLYPELYKELTKVSYFTDSMALPVDAEQGRSLSYKTFFTWLTISVYQGGIIMLLSLLLFESEFLHIVAISFTALVINELIMVALEITTWHRYMILSELGTAVVYFGSMAVLPAYFGASCYLDAARGHTMPHVSCYPRTAMVTRKREGQTDTERCRSIIRPIYGVLVQSGSHSRRLFVPTVHDQSRSTSVQARRLYKSCGYLDTS